MIFPEIRELQVFIALERTGSFSAAAKKLGITQPAVSAHIAKLEQLIGYPLFHRGPDGTTPTEQGASLIPFIKAVESEYGDLLRRADYWKRSQSNEVKIWTDGSIASRELQRARFNKPEPHANEWWQDLKTGVDWVGALKKFEVDIVITGSFLKAGDVPGVRTTVISREAGITLCWNPDYYPFQSSRFSFPDALSSSIILPVDSLALGFRDFLSNWCASSYDFSLIEFIECRSEQEGIDACKLGLGVMILPGNAEQRINLSHIGLSTTTAFEFLLPKAFTFGIRSRTHEQNPQILATIDLLRKSLGDPG